MPGTGNQWTLSIKKMHIVFQEEDVNILSKSFGLDESLRAQIILIRDDYSVGPLKDVYTQAGTGARKEWWKNVLSGGDFSYLADNKGADDNQKMGELKKNLNENREETFWIWVAPNNQDVSGYYWLVAQLKEFAGRVYVLSLNNLPFINEKGNIFYPTRLFEIPPREFLKAKKLARQITLSEFEMDADEWTKLGNENKIVRILEGNKKLLQYDEDYYDDELEKYITTDWQKAGKVIHRFLSKAKETTGEAYLLWRLKIMIAGDILEVQGKVENMKDFELKMKSSEFIIE